MDSDWNEYDSYYTQHDMEHPQAIPTKAGRLAALEERWRMDEWHQNHVFEETERPWDFDEEGVCTGLRWAVRWGLQDTVQDPKERALLEAAAEALAESVETLLEARFRVRERAARLIATVAPALGAEGACLVAMAIRAVNGASGYDGRVVVSGFGKDAGEPEAFAKLFEHGLELVSPCYS